MRRSLLARLRISGLYSLSGAFLLLIVIPLYQIFVLNPLGYARVLAPLQSGLANVVGVYLLWINQYTWPFIVYRFLLTAAFALLLTLPFSLFRIIVAQEILAQPEQTQEEEEDEEEEAAENGQAEEADSDGMPVDAWRGKGFAVVAAWAGLAGLVISILGTIIGTLYLLVASRAMGSGGADLQSAALFTSIFSVLTNTVGIGLIAISTLFFGAMIARSGLRIWPGIWLTFGYVAIAVTALLSGSAVAIASSPLGQSPLTTPGTILYALWVLWFGIMLVRLKPEQE